MNAVLEQISKIGIVPVVKIDNAADALPLAKALCAGGLPCAEVTFRTSAAAEAIKIMTDNVPSMCVGAGTVLNAEQVDAAVAAGAKFIVSPGLNPRTVKYCVEKNIPITPGTSSPGARMDGHNDRKLKYNAPQGSLDFAGVLFQSINITVLC